MVVVPHGLSKPLFYFSVRPSPKFYSEAAAETTIFELNTEEGLQENITSAALAGSITF